ncbi:Lrp/AsnC family transcriptional regulator [Candidatus Bathyarchaeota archaeon]|nr:MAG: Lrp/AsnC family transcriptional regulator [Candidatus Bathyarchaeota archaeon]
MKVLQLQIRFPCKQNLEKFRPFPIFFRPYLSQIAPQEYLERINRFVSFLDPGNVKIATAMKKYGLRNLQLIADKTRIPRPTVHARVSRLEKEGLLRTWIHPNYAKLGLVRAMVLLTTKPGRELLAPEALRIPGYWLRLIRCMGECNGYYSTHAIPFGKRWDFEQYLEKIVASGIATRYRVLWLGEAISPLPDFSYYDAMKKTWTFDWPRWLQELAAKPLHTQRKEAQLGGGFDKKDLIILKELVKDGRTKLTQLARLLDMTVPAVKYRFDNLERSGFIREYVIDMLPFAPEISDLYEMVLDFKTREGLGHGERVLSTLPIVRTLSRVEGSNSIAVRMYLPRAEMNNLLTMLSALSRTGVLAGFTFVMLDPMTIRAQTFSYEFYEDNTGWRYDNLEYFEQLRRVSSAFDKEEDIQVTFQSSPVMSFQ